MVDALQTSLQSYNLQLQQVEAALSIDPENEELSKLKEDLEKVVTLTKDLIKQQLAETLKRDHGSTTEDVATDDVSIAHCFNVGDTCLVLNSDDGQYYEGVIEDMTEDGEQVSVKLSHNNQIEVTSVVLLRKATKKAEKKKFTESQEARNIRRQQAQREYLKKKKLKKQMRYKQLEEEREVEKNKWLAFTTKKKGGALLKKSIFASPDSVNGRVGIGTCGVSGLPMTEFSHAEKRRKGV